MRSALLLGATGLVGRHTLSRLATDARWSRVVSLDRRPLAVASPTHTSHVVDFTRLDAVDPDVWVCDDVFCAIGTTIRQAGSHVAFRHVDLDIPASAATHAHAAGATQMLLVSAMGADAGSRIFYNRTKGQVEAAVRGVGFEAVHLLRPSLLTGDRTEARTGEQIGEAVLRLLNPVLVGPLKNLRPTPADDVAAALVGFAAERQPGVHVHDPEQIRQRAAR